MDATVFHVYFVDGLVVLVEGGGVQELDGIEMRYHSNQFILLAVLLQQLLDFPSTFPHIRGLLSNLLAAHKLAHLLHLLPVHCSLQMSLLQELEIFLLVLVRIVLYEPKLALGLHPRKVELGELGLFYLDAPAYLGTMLESLTQQRLYDMRTFSSPKN